MTVKEIAEFFGKSEDTILRHSKKIGIEIENGISKIFSIDDVKTISKALYKKVPLAVKESIDLLTSSNAVGKPIVNAEVGKIERLENMVEKLIGLTTALLTNQSQSRLEYKQDYYSIIGYANFKGIADITTSEAKELSIEAKKLSIELEKEIRKIPDERWGHLNSYHITILEKVFEI